LFGALAERAAALARLELDGDMANECVDKVATLKTRVAIVFRASKVDR
jgi:hypothetical protein